MLAGDWQWGSVYGYGGTDGTPLWSIANPEAGVTGIAAGDTDNDGSNEVLWGGGVGSTARDALFIGDWVSETVEWDSVDLDGPLVAAAGDIDLDGQAEVVMASLSTNSDGGASALAVYDGSTHDLEWSTMVPFKGVFQVAVGQLDADSAGEIAINSANNTGFGGLGVYDGITHALEWQSPSFGDYVQPWALVVQNLDADGVDEIIVGLSDYSVKVLDGAGPVIEWDSGSLDRPIQDMAVGDLDGNGVLDLAVLTELTVYVWETGTWVQRSALAPTNSRTLAITNGDLAGPGELLIAAAAYYYGMDAQLVAWDADLQPSLWQRSLGGVSPCDISSAELDGDGDEEFVLMGGGEPSWSCHVGTDSLLIVGSQIGLSYVTEYRAESDWGPINGMAVADLDNDGQLELALGCDTLIYTNDISALLLTLHTRYLPLILHTE